MNISRRSLLQSAAAVAATPLLTSTASLAAIPQDMVVMAKSIDDIVNGFDPAEVYELTNYEVCTNIYQNLVTIDPADTTKMIGDLAESWDISADGKTITFKMKPGIVFESGLPLTAQDVAFSLQRAIKLGKAPSADFSALGWTPENIEKTVQAAGDATVVISLPEPWAPSLILQSLTLPFAGVVDKTTVMSHDVGGDLGNAWLRGHSAGSGPYRLVNWQASDSITLAANPKAAVKPKTARVIIRHVGDPAVQSLLLQKGDVDMARDLGSDQLTGARQNKDLHIIQADSLVLMYLAMNMGRSVFDKPQVRQALKWAIDYDAIATHLTADTWGVWQSFVPKGTVGATGGATFKRDPAKAKQLLTEAGLPDGFSVTLDHIAGKPYADIAQAVQANLAEIGVKVQLISGETSQVFSKMRARQHELIISYWSPAYSDPNYNAQAFCVSLDDSDATSAKTAAWRQHFSDPALSAAVQAAAREVDETKRLAMYKNIQDTFLASSPFAFMLQKYEIAVARKGLSGFQLGILPNYTRYAGMAKA